MRIDEHKEHLGLKLGTMGRNEKLPKAFTNQPDRVVIVERAERLSLSLSRKEETLEEIVLKS